MKILVLNGSPKGEMSVTYHHVLFLEKHYRNINFEYIHIGQLYKKLSDQDYVETLIEKMRAVDAVMWSYPVYTFSVPYQLMCLVEALLEHPKSHLLKDILTFQLSTSKHFYDVTAYNYLHQCMESLNMSHIKGHMADMSDLLNDDGRKQLVSFFDQVVHHITQKLLVMKKYSEYKAICHPFDYEPVAEKDKIASNILIIYNGEDYSGSLKHMIEAFSNLVRYNTHFLDLSNVTVQGGCLGCMKCMVTGQCVYTDDFEAMYREKVLYADIVIYASDIKNHWFHSDFKCFHDRAFFNGHRISKKGRAVGYLLAGNLRNESNLQEVIEARASVGNLHLLDVVTNEDENTLEKIDCLAKQVEYFMKHRPEAATTFYGLGGMKIYRDLVYDLRSYMLKDHVHFKKEKLYDFPKRASVKHFFVSLGMKWMTHPKRLDKYSVKLNEHMIYNYKEQIEKY